MSLESLHRLSMERKLATRGEQFRSHIMELSNPVIRRQPEVKPLIECLRRVFGIEHFEGLEPTVLWSDDMRNLGSEESFYTEWKDVYMLGVFYRKNVYDEDQLSHVFIRKFQGFRGPLDEWKSDIIFPPDTRRYSVCAVIPAEHESSPEERRDPHNYAVTKYLFKDFQSLGLDFETIKRLVMEL